MITLSVTPDEARKLREIFEYALSELRMEIAGTESYDWRRELHSRKALLIKLLQQLEEERSTEPA
jgi:hypothetical protein